MQRQARDLRVKRCGYCWRNWGITNMTRSDAGCDFHHRYRLCPTHGGLDCTTREGGCLGSLRIGVHPDVPAWALATYRHPNTTEE
jgi:hypothetical protein